MQNFIEYTNYDGIHVNTNCGEVAITTLLVNKGKIDNGPDAVKFIENQYPPDILFGWFGTSPTQIQTVCEKFGCPLQKDSGVDNLIKCLQKGKLCILLIGWMEGLKPCGHWTVAHKFNDNIVSLANYDDVKIEDIDSLWSNIIPVLGGMKNSFFYN